MDVLLPLVDAIKTELENKSQDDLAHELEIPQSTISALVRGERRIGHKTLNAILAARPEWARLLIGCES